MKAVVVMAVGQSIVTTGEPPDSATYSEFTTMSSGETLSGWVASFNGRITGTLSPLVTTAHGPGPITWTRTKQ